MMTTTMATTKQAARQWLALGLAAALWGAAAAVQAQGFASAASVNRSEADQLVVDTGLWTDVFQARSATQLAAPQQVDAATWRLEHRLAFAVGYEVEESLTAANLILGGEHDLAYDLSFTISDPARVGYTLTLDSLVAGVMRSTGERATLPAFTFAVNYGLGFVDLADLTSTARTLYGEESSLVVNEARRLVLGEFFGTRSFDLRVRTPSEDAAAFGRLADTRPTYVQFGLPLTSPLFTGGTYPSFDGSGASDHGQFLTVQAVFNTSPVPEPESWALLAVGLGLVALRGRGPMAARSPSWPAR